MKKKTLMIFAGAVLILLAVLTLPKLVLQMREQKLLTVTRTADASLMEFFQEENTTLVQRMNILVSTSSAYTSLNAEVVGNRFGEPQLLADRCLEELRTVFPDTETELKRFPSGTQTAVNFRCYMEPFTKQTVVVASCEFTYLDAVFTVGLDVATKKIVDFSIEKGNIIGLGSSHRMSVEGRNFVKTLLAAMDFARKREAEEWFGAWAAYWGLTVDYCAGEAEWISGSLSDPANQGQRIAYQRSIEEDNVYFTPVLRSEERGE